MSRKWDKYSRFGLEVASTATSIGFSAAKTGTRLGFGITRGIASTAAGITGSALDHAFFGGRIGAGSLLGGAVSTAISAIESLALAPLLIGESITSTSLVAAHSTLSVLSTIFPGSDEASFSLASFVTLVRREWTEPVDHGGLPEERYGVGKIWKALVGWATLQGVTSQWQEQQWFYVLREIHVNDSANTLHQDLTRDGTQAELHIRTDDIFPSQGGQIVTADIGEADGAGPTAPTTPPETMLPPSLIPPSEMKPILRRLSRLVLAGYGGPSLLFFGVPWTPSPPGGSRDSPSAEKEKRKEELKLAHAVGASEGNASSIRNSKDDPRVVPGKPAYSWWNVLMGRHDRDIFLQYANSQDSSHAITPGEPQSSQSAQRHQPLRPLTAYVGSERLMPRFWVLTDHARREVVLVIRGTMSLNELAVDLTCDPTPFELRVPRRRPSKSKSRSKSAVDQRETHIVYDEATDWSEFDEELENIPGAFPMDLSTPPRPPRPLPVPGPSQSDSNTQEPEQWESTTYLVHGGMLKMARAMGAPGKPVHVAVRGALRRNRGYSLVLCGHSLGAGVAALLALMWANPHTRLTHRRSGLPQRRSVSAYCIAPPCLTSTDLGKLAGESGLITSFVYGHDVVSRLSLGSVRDLTRAAAWLCKAEEVHGEGYSTVTKRALKWKTNIGKEGDEDWFLAMRKTLEANMQQTQLFPPGRVFWALRDGDLHPAHRIRDARGRLQKSDRGEEKVRLFEVLEPERAFGQIVFARDMLSSHVPHQYDRVLNELL
ncbi:alpha/beta-hydrolase [Wolfiporia cocos MD-104 SS10]|uniref:sn-1-specific diacylglycerol lipase n=1 Tax=Wolfiporia cocos (strain MD-104) TaxID=742152 RepID=A0A2H3JS82_WOLCO|nr:alpha/beta-hydrolase [Wolfiporia cocos MD-104 SS10]